LAAVGHQVRLDLPVRRELKGCQELQERQDLLGLQVRKEFLGRWDRLERRAQLALPVCKDCRVLRGQRDLKDYKVWRERQGRWIRQAGWMSTAHPHSMSRRPALPLIATGGCRR
jgi:hypothetical protein